MHVLSIGECMAELSPLLVDGVYALGFAGDTFNTAWYLARCAPEVTVSYLTAIGADRLSNDLRALIAQSGISDAFVQTSDDRTLGLYLISLDNGERSFSYWRDQSAARTLADDPDLLKRAINTADIVYFSGITYAILDAGGRSNLLAALRQGRRDGKTIVFDPNLRPRLWGSDAEMLDSIMDAARVSDVVLPSFEDEADWFGDADKGATAARYSEAGATTIIVKDGGRSVLYRSRDGQGEVAVDPLGSVTDSTAAGDSFNAGYLAAMSRGWALEDCVRAGCGVSRQVVQECGALVEIDLELAR